MSRGKDTKPELGSFRPRAEVEQKSFAPKAPPPSDGVSGVGGSVRPQSPPGPATGQDKPPPAGDD